MPRIVHFEIEAEDMDRATEFYKSVFDRHDAGRPVGRTVKQSKILT